jgi:hypothetical protein
MVKESGATRKRLTKRAADGWGEYEFTSIFLASSLSSSLALSSPAHPPLTQTVGRLSLSQRWLFPIYFLGSFFLGEKMINDILSLAELIRGLAQRKNELDKQYFENFIKPIWESFSVVHKDYKESFTKYHNLLLQNESSSKIIEDILALLSQDSELTSDLRSELSSLIKNLPSSAMKAKESLLLNFISAIMGYFHDDNRQVVPIINLRAAMLEVVSDVAEIASFDEDVTKENLKKILENSIHHIQLHYAEVSDSYYQIRKELLT